MILCFDQKGIGYITDNGREPETAIFKFENDTITPWLSSDQILTPNGILIHEGHLLVGDKRDFSIKSIRISDQTIDTLAIFQENGAPGTFDGLQDMEDGRILTSAWSGPGYLITPSCEISENVNTAELNSEI